MTKYKFKDENGNWQTLVQDVKVNGESVSNGVSATIQLKTINNQSIIGTGNIDIQGGSGEYVEYRANQGLTTQQKLNARNNIDAVGNGQIKQSTGDGTLDVISQKGVSDLLALKQNAKPDGTHTLIASDTGKLNLIYIPSTVLGGITNGGMFNEYGIINASSYAPELDGRDIRDIQFASYPSYYFIYSGSTPADFFGYTFATGDWAISLGNGWAKLNATDAVTSVNGMMGNVWITADSIDAVYKYWGNDNGNKNLVTNEYGQVVLSDFALGQIIVDYYSELPNVNPDLPHQNIPERARATVLKPEDIKHNYTVSELQDSWDNGTPLSHEVRVYWAPERPTVTDQYVVFNDNDNYYNVYYDTQLAKDAVLWIDTIEPVTGNSVYYVFSWSEQFLVWDESATNVPLYFDTWTKITFDYITGDPSSEQADWGQIPYLSTDVYVADMSVDSNDVFADSFVWFETKLSGEYTYMEVTPSTDPITYYWAYTPSNVQADWNEEDALSLAYVNNRPYLDTTSTTSLSTHARELIKGTVQLHKVSKTGNYTHLSNEVGVRDTNTTTGEIFNDYNNNTARGQYAHAEGYSTTASGEASHAEGRETVASWNFAHAEGQLSSASGLCSHAEGYNSTASGQNSHAEGYSCKAQAINAHAEGYQTYAKNNASHSEGNGTQAVGDASHAEGYGTIANGSYSHAEGLSTLASSNYSHAEGQSSTVYGICGHAEGYGTQVNSDYGHAEGYQTYANGTYSHAEGWTTTASGQYTHTEGKHTIAASYGAHAEGEDTQANGSWSHAEGQGTIAQSSHQHVQGKWNIADGYTSYAHIVGNGTGTNARSNMHTLDWSGNAWYSGDLKIGGVDYAHGNSVVTSVNNTTPVSGNVTISIPTDTNDLTNGAGYITGITSSDVTTALGYTPLANLNQSVTTLTGTSITLVDNSINTLTPTGNTTFTLPTITDTTIFHQILVQLDLSTVYTIDLGTTTYFGGTAPDLSATGNYNLIYEYDNAMAEWVVGAVNKA